VAPRQRGRRVPAWRSPGRPLGLARAQQSQVPGLVGDRASKERDAAWRTVPPQREDPAHGQFREREKVGLQPNRPCRQKEDGLAHAVWPQRYRERNGGGAAADGTCHCCFACSCCRVNCCSECWWWQSCCCYSRRLYWPWTGHCYPCRRTKPSAQCWPVTKRSEATRARPAEWKPTAAEPGVGALSGTPRVEQWGSERHRWLPRPIPQRRWQSASARERRHLFAFAACGSSPHQGSVTPVAARRRLTACPLRPASRACSRGRCRGCVCRVQYAGAASMASVRTAVEAANLLKATSQGRLMQLNPRRERLVQLGRPCRRRARETVPQRRRSGYCWLGTGRWSGLRRQRWRTNACLRCWCRWSPCSCGCVHCHLRRIPRRERTRSQRLQR